MKNKLNLDSVEWKDFKIENLFFIKKVFGKPINTYKKGLIPYISTSSENNGVIDFIISNNDNIFSRKKAISIDPIKGKAFYHNYDFVGRGFSEASINLLYNKYLNKYIGFFICTCIEKSSFMKASFMKASYGNLYNSRRLSESKILLPIDEKGEPNWQFMEDYIKQQQRVQYKKIIDYYKKCQEE